VNGYVLRVEQWFDIVQVSRVQRYGVLIQIKSNEEKKERKRKRKGPIALYTNFQMPPCQTEKGERTLVFSTGVC
jgi:hypothetical protein